MPACFFFDIDGTFVDRTNRVPKSAWQAVEALREKGHYCFLCSGRNLPSALSFAMPEMDGVIYCSGAGAVYEGEHIFQKTIDEEDLRWVHAMLEENGSGYILFAEQIGFANARQLKVFEGFGAESGLSPQQIRHVYALQEIGKYNGEKILKIDASVPKSAIDVFLHELPGSLCWIPTEYGSQPADRIYGEISQKDVTKGTAALAVMKYLDIDQRDSYAFGDSMNDAALLRVCGTAVAMADGSDSLKKMADLVTDAPSEDGIAGALKQLQVL